VINVHDTNSRLVAKSNKYFRPVETNSNINKLDWGAAASSNTRWLRKHLLTSWAFVTLIRNK